MPKRGNEIWYDRLPEPERSAIDALREGGFYVGNKFTWKVDIQFRVTVLWSNPAEHFHVTQIGIRGAAPVSTLSHLVAFSELQILTHHGVPAEVVVEMVKRLPNCRVVNEE